MTYVAPSGVVMLEKAFSHGQFEPAFLLKLSKLVNVVEECSAENASTVPSLYVLDGTQDPLAAAERCRRIRQTVDAGVLIVLNRNRGSKYLNQLKRAGLTGALNWTCSEEELASAVYRVVAGVSFIDPSLL